MPSIASYVTQVLVVDTSHVEIKHAAGTTASQKPPLLAIELAVEGANLVCRTELSTIVPRFLAIFDKAITITQVMHILWLHSAQTLMLALVESMACAFRLAL